MLPYNHDGTPSSVSDLLDSLNLSEHVFQGLMRSIERGKTHRLQSAASYILDPNVRSLALAFELGSGFYYFRLAALKLSIAESQTRPDEEEKEKRSKDLN